MKGWSVVGCPTLLSAHSAMISATRLSKPHAMIYFALDGCLKAKKSLPCVCKCFFFFFWCWNARFLLSTYYWPVATCVATNQENKVSPSNATLHSRPPFFFFFWQVKARHMRENHSQYRYASHLAYYVILTLVVEAGHYCIHLTQYVEQATVGWWLLANDEPML